jgi:CHAT domain-containing protein
VEEVRTAYLGDKMAIYSDLVLTLLAAPLPSDDEVAEAFAVVERARSRALLERLLATVDAAAPDESAEISEQRASLRRQLHWLYNQLLGESGNRHLAGALSREVAQHEAAIQQLEWRSAPLLAQAEPVQMAELQAMLMPDQQALVYYFAGDEVLAFVVGREQAQVVRRVATVREIDEALAELRFQLGRVEMGSDYVTRHAARLLIGVQNALQRLYALLVAPVQEAIHSVRLLLVPYGVLHLIPFHALWDGSHYWLERMEISYVPSASIAVHNRGSAGTKLARFAGFAPYDEQIPQAQAEIALAATFFPEARRYHDEDATIAHLKAAAAESDVLHLATHGLFRPDNSFFSALKLADGWIDVRELYRLTLSARLVVLSACESGVGEVRAGDDVVGLARGFLAAGAQNLVASLWNVHDRSAAEFMGRFYEVLQRERVGDSLVRPARPAWALRMAQVEAIEAGRHPYFWASFFAIG